MSVGFAFFFLNYLLLPGLAFMIAVFSWLLSPYSIPLLASFASIHLISTLCSHTFLFSFLPCGAVAFYSLRAVDIRGV